MNDLTEFFNEKECDALTGVVYKNNQIKRNIISYMAINGQCTLAELTRELNISIPTITKLVGELQEKDIVVDNGKIETAGGRRPNIFGLADTAIYFAGVDVAREKITFIVTDLKNNVIYSRLITDFNLEDTAASLDLICSYIDESLNLCGIDRSKVLGIGLSIIGRVSPVMGRSYKYFTSYEESLTELIEQRVGIRILLENDSRARCYAEYCFGDVNNEKNVLYLHLGRGVAVGIVVDGKLYYGKSGFAGEFGHTPFFDNEIICACGKKGCLETEVSGIAVERKMISKIEAGVNTVFKKYYDAGERIHINDIIKAAHNDDMLSIELIEEVGEKVGKSIAFLINIFNPETVVIGGNLANAGDLLMLPMKSSVNKFSLGLVYKDTKFSLTKLDEDQAGALGVAMLIRNKVIGV